ncbi:MAG: hypothetical protein QNJ36_10340, partial [Calothrix sp. MO_167.B42]|nr:hypothetical protein [Calothrix sp. MO_167.B42]
LIRRGCRRRVRFYKYSSAHDITTIEEQLDQVLESLDLIGTIQRGIRAEMRDTSQSTARLERTVRQLAEISARTQAVVVR